MTEQEQKEKEIRQLDYLISKLGFSEQDILTVCSHPGWNPGRIIAEFHRLDQIPGFQGEQYAREHFFEANPDLLEEYSPVQEEQAAQSPRHAKKASEFGEDTTTFLWYPYLPNGEYTVLMADGGVGKTVLCCGIAAAVSAGQMLPGDDRERLPQAVLIVSAEDRGETLKHRLELSDADLDLCYILDCRDSIGMNIDDRFQEFSDTVKQYKPGLVIVDPWHAFLGADVDISRVNAIRPILQKLAALAKTCDCAIIAISHVNKRSQGENANHAATGSTDFINAARSALRLIFDDEDEEHERRIMVHTKSNYAGYGKSVAYCIEDGGVVWDGFSEITKQTLEAASRNRQTPTEQLHASQEKQAASANLIHALIDYAQNTELCGKRISYEAFKMQYGEDIFGDRQPKRVMDSIIPDMLARGYLLETGKTIKTGSTTSRGFYIRKMPAEEEATPE